VLLPLKNSETPNRLHLAEWLVDAGNPLTARVTVNRIWMRYFGRGLVETENDFGTQGTPPTHPKLLDWLSREFVRKNWSLKSLHKLTVMSATYQQSSYERHHLSKMGSYSCVELKAGFDRDGILVLTLRGNLSRSAKTTVRCAPRGEVTKPDSKDALRPQPGHANETPAHPASTPTSSHGAEPCFASY
jgi:hypothetical protein